MNNCTHCESINIRKFGSLTVRFADIPFKQKPVFLGVKRQRFQCKVCKKTFFEALPEFDEKRRCTNRLKEWLIQESFSQSFIDLAEQTGLSESTIRNIFKEYAKSQGVDFSARKAAKALKKLEPLRLIDEADQHGEE